MPISSESLIIHVATLGQAPHGLSKFAANHGDPDGAWPSEKISYPPIRASIRKLVDP